VKRIFYLCLIIIALLFTYGCTNEDVIIHFESNGGSVIQDMKVSDFDINTLPVPEKIGFTFVGWFLDEGLITPLDKTIDSSQSITLYAKYTTGIFTLFFESNGGTEINPVTTSFFSSSLPAPQAPVKEHYSFAGWYLEESFENLYVFNLPIIQDMTLYAKWVPVEYTMTFETNNGSTVSSISRTVEQLSIIKPDNPTKDGHQFIGWYLDEAFLELYTFSAPIHSNVTLYAKWEETIQLVTITFETN